MPTTTKPMYDDTEESVKQEWNFFHFLRQYYSPFYVFCAYNEVRLWFHWVHCHYKEYNMQQGLFHSTLLALWFIIIGDWGTGSLLCARPSASGTILLTVGIIMEFFLSSEDYFSVVWPAQNRDPSFLAFLCIPASSVLRIWIVWTSCGMQGATWT